MALLINNRGTSFFFSSRFIDCRRQVAKWLIFDQPIVSFIAKPSSVHRKVIRLLFEPLGRCLLKPQLGFVGMRPFQRESLMIKIPDLSWTCALDSDHKLLKVRYCRRGSWANESWTGGLPRSSCTFSACRQSQLFRLAVRKLTAVISSYLLDSCWNYNLFFMLRCNSYPLLKKIIHKRRGNCPNGTRRIDKTHTRRIRWNSLLLQS